MSVNKHGWFLWCGVGTIDDLHEEVRNLTKAEALTMAETMAEKWPRVLIGQVCAKYPRGIYRGGIEYGRRCGIAEIQEI